METLLSDYVLLEQLGAGGMGRVFAAMDRSTGRAVAIKLLHPKRGRDGEAVPSTVPLAVPLIGEIEAARRVSHANVVRYLDHGMTPEGTPYLVMERLVGTPLGALIRRDGPILLSRILRIGSQLLDGLEAVHRARLAHADVKSDNLIVDAQADDHCTIIDFGIARELSGAAEPEGQIVTGTPDYMAPELIHGGAPTAASDLYGVGVILYEMLTATTPFGGGAADDVFDRQLTEPVVPPSIRYADRHIPQALEDLIVQALDKRPEARPSSAGAFAHALRSALPPSYEHDDPSALVAFSPTRVTRDWTRPTLSPTKASHAR